MRPGQAIMQLSALGYNFTLEAEHINYAYQGDGEPAFSRIAQLFEAIKADKEAAVLFLRIHCQRCGSMMSWHDLNGREHCMGCNPPDWKLTEEVCERLERKARAMA